MGTKASITEQKELPTVEAGDDMNPPAAGRAKRRGHGDEGFSLIEIMAGMAIIAILAMAVLPQFNKYFERAAIQNLSGEINNAALLVESDHSLTGASGYVFDDVERSVAETEVGAETELLAELDGKLNNKKQSLGFKITGTNTAVKNYDLVYYGGEADKQSGLHVEKKKK